MTSARQIAAILPATLGAMLAAACAPKNISGPLRPGQALVVLLPDAEDGSTGRAQVSNQGGSKDLAAERQATQATANRQPGPSGTLSEADVQRIFGDALSALPPAPARFTLFFRFESDELTEESRALVPEILKTVKEHSVADVDVVGHTDTLGTPEANFELGLMRAASVRNLLVEAGLDTSTIQITTHGEADLLIQTPDETPEPRNRRVEISVR